MPTKALTSKASVGNRKTRLERCMRENQVFS